MTTSLEEQIQQRRSNLEALSKLGIEIYPHKFERRHTVSELVNAYGNRSHDDLEAGRIATVTSGRILAIRSFGKANCVVISDRLTRIQNYARQDAVPEPDLNASKL